MIIKGLIAFSIFIIIPVLLGFLILKFIKKEKDNILLALVLGYVIEFGICEILAVPMIFAECKFTDLLYTFYAIIIILALISFIINLKSFKQILKINIDKLKSMPKLLTIICILLIGFQIANYLIYTHIDDDDAFYVGSATTSIYTNTIFKYSPTTGELAGEHLDLRYRLGPFPLFLAITSSVLNIHPAITAHSIFTVVFVILVYVIYYLLGRTIFKENMKQVLFFLILINVLYIFGNYSIRTNFTFFLFRIWQGKAIFCNMFFPLIMLLFLKANENDFKFNYCLLLFLTILAGNLTTTMGIGLTVIELMLLSVVFEISKIDFKNLRNNNYSKNIKNILKVLVCTSPSLILALIYFL